MERYEGNLSRLRLRRAELHLRTAMLRVTAALKAGFRPEQARVPSGRPDGGEWTHAPGYAQVHQVARRRAGGGQIRIGGRWHPITPAQEARLAQSYGAMRRALRDVRKLEPNWKPPAQAYSTVEGLISANRSIELEARFRMFQLVGTRAEPGPYAREWVTAPVTNHRLNRFEQWQVDRLGRKWGCHRCGSTDPKTPSGSFIGDHQVPKSIGTPTRIYPHCLRCSASQGGLIRNYRRRVSE